MAQEREKTRIVLASVLKPVDDTRMTAKMGTTLAKAGHLVTVIGYPSSGDVPNGITAKPLREFKRLSISRRLARWQVFRIAFGVHPNVFIFTTHELIFPALLLKILLGTRIIYDVRENYYRNISHSEGLPRLLRWPLAAWVRGIEKVTAPMIDHFFIAEQGYDKEFRFHRGGWTLLENKAQETLQVSGSPVSRVSGLKLLFSGTLSESTGVFRAMRLATILHDQSPDVFLTVSGYAAVTATQKKIRALAEGKSYIRLIGIENLVPHEEIQRQIEAANAGIIGYQRLPHTTSSVPTKLFEYLQASLPIITDDGWTWIERFSSCSPFVITNLDNPNAGEVLKLLRANNFYSQQPDGTSWNSEEDRLLAAVKC